MRGLIWSGNWNTTCCSSLKWHMMLRCSRRCCSLRWVKTDFCLNFKLATFLLMSSIISFLDRSRSVCWGCRTLICCVYYTEYICGLITSAAVAALRDSARNQHTLPWRCSTDVSSSWHREPGLLLPYMAQGQWINPSMLFNSSRDHLDGWLVFLWLSSNLMWTNSFLFVTFNSSLKRSKGSVWSGV